MSTNRGPPGRLPNGINGYTNGFCGHSDDGSDTSTVVPPTRATNSDSSTTPRVLLEQRLAEAPSRRDLMTSIPTSHPPFFASTPAYTHNALPARGSLSPEDGIVNSTSGAAVVNGFSPTTAATRSRYPSTHSQNGSHAATTEGVQLSSITDRMFIPTPYNSPLAPGESDAQPVRRLAPPNPRTPDSPHGRGPNDRQQWPDSPHPDIVPRGTPPPAALNEDIRTDIDGNTLAPPNTPVTPEGMRRATRTTPSSNPQPVTGRWPHARSYNAYMFGSADNPTRRNGGGPRKKKGKFTNGKGATAKKGAAKDKILDDASLAVAHGASPIYTENIPAILQHSEALAVLSSAPAVNASNVLELLSNGDMKEVVAAFVANGKAGQNDPDWLEDAVGASARRDAGEFDALLEEKFESVWGEEGGEEEEEDEEGAIEGVVA